MSRLAFLAAPVVLVTSAWLTYLALRFASLRGILDIPNERSSHTAKTPRGGGIAIVATMTLASAVLTWQGVLSGRLFAALACGGIAVAVIGYLDDRHRLRAGWRLGVHLVSAVWAVSCVGGLQVVQIGERLVHAGWFGTALAVLGVVWVLNLFNFMDGIDGLAASEALFVCGAAALLTGSTQVGVPSAAWVFACACGGFLCWNWPPARVFLGDVGSGYLGYVTIVLALADSRDHPAAIWTWFILGALFFVDATLTLLRRLFRGEKVTEAHRQHAYQRLARRWGRHLPVTAGVIAVNLLWLFPLAFLASAHPKQASTLALIAATPLLLVSVFLGAGRREN